jgi:pimeloyl-ACP methyl ester carboxylesterase
VWGENDREVSIEDGRRIHEQIPNSRLFVFHDCGHLPHEEYPEEFLELVSEFCCEQIQEPEGRLLAT